MRRPPRNPEERQIAHTLNRRGFILHKDRKQGLFSVYDPFENRYVIGSETEGMTLTEVGEWINLLTTEGRYND